MGRRRWRLSRPVLVLSAVGTLVGGAALFKLQRGGPRFDPEASTRAEGLTAVVTGAAAGLGRELTRELAARGATVVMACRDPEGCEAVRREVVLATRNKKVYCRSLDVADLDSVRAFAARVLAEFPEVHALVNNAAVMRCPRSVTRQGLELQLATNHLGPFLLTRLLLPALRRAPGGARVVDVTCADMRNGALRKHDFNWDQEYDAGGAYAQSKLATALRSAELSRREPSLLVILAQPGLADTQLGRHLPLARSTVYGAVLRPFLWTFLRAPQHAAQTLLRAVLDPELPAAAAASKSEGLPTLLLGPDGERERPPETAVDPAAADWLWRVSERWTGLDPGSGSRPRPQPQAPSQPQPQSPLPA